MKKTGSATFYWEPAEDGSKGAEHPEAPSQDEQGNPHFQGPPRRIVSQPTAQNHSRQRPQEQVGGQKLRLLAAGTGGMTQGLPKFGVGFKDEPATLARVMVQIARCTP